MLIGFQVKSTFLVFGTKPRDRNYSMSLSVYICCAPTTDIPSRFEDTFDNIIYSYLHI